jgi:prepilin-type N-terminal cleavage/methylation domain-containing protein
MIRAPVFPRGISGPTFAALRRGEQPRSGGCCSHSQFPQRASAHPSDHRSLINHNSVRAGFTLLELLVVMGIIALLMVLVAPAFTNLKSAGDITSAAYTIKGALDTARTYAKANNTYTWVGFFEENLSSMTPGTAGIGRLVISIVASKDGTNVYGSGTGNIDAGRLIQVGKLTKIENVHLTPNLPTFGSRATVSTTYRIPDAADSTTPFQYPVASPAPTPQYTFVKVVQFGPIGEARINNNSSALQTAAEIGLEPTHGNVAPSSTPANLVAVQVTGLSGEVTIYRK